jgi:pyruvate dehydrogenase E2 component (dihydrolipoamide acetyltransferase)
VRADVEAAAARGVAAPAAQRAEAPGIDVSTLKGETTTLEPTRMQRAIARRMAESKATIPDFTLQREVDMEACAGLRAELKRLFENTPPGAPPPAPAPTYNDMILKASALALREHPHVNGSWRDGALRLHSRINVGVAVATDDGLVVPTVFDADQKSLGEISHQARLLAGRVREQTITPPELAGGTFSVSNLGMYGIERFTAIINPPQVAILAVGAVQPRVVARGGEATVRSMVTLTLVCDHRALYGADAARFLARVAELLESPAALTL